MEPNCTCSACGKSIYKKPHTLNLYKDRFCNKICRNTKNKQKCLICSCLFFRGKKTQRFCSRACSNINRKGLKYLKNKSNNKSNQRLNTLKDKFHFETCMVENCTYNKTYDIDRFIPGALGGEYIIGNMFAICPNHHAEVTRKIIILEKVNNFTLRISSS